MSYDAVRDILRAQLSHRWPTADGVVVTSRVKKREADEDGTESYSAVIEYEYTVNGENKKSDKIAIARISSGRNRDAEAMVRKYPEESRVRVYLSPRDSSVSVLEPGLGWPHFSKLIVALLFLITGCVMLWAFGWLRWLGL